MYAAEEDYEDVDYGEKETQEDLRKDYEDALKAEDDKLEEAGRKVRGSMPSPFNRLSASDSASHPFMLANSPSNSAALMPSSSVKSSFM